MKHPERIAWDMLPEDEGPYNAPQIVTCIAGFEKQMEQEGHKELPNTESNYMRFACDMGVGLTADSRGYLIRTDAPLRDGFLTQKHIDTARAREAEYSEKKNGGVWTWERLHAALGSTVRAGGE